MIGSKDTPRWLLGLAGIALLIGTWARFKGLGTWSFGVDEYYISRSIDFILMSGLPEYPCGGYYQRGIVYQYIVAGLRLLDLSPEFSARVVTAVSSLAVLPAAWLLGRRLHSPTVGWLAVIVLALSLWEIEMARFARMYIPFQAVFAWYLLYFLRFTVDRNERAAMPMVLLSVLGALLWEGGVLLAAANLLPALVQHRNGCITRRGWAYIFASLPVAAVLAAITFARLRHASDVPPYPDDFGYSGDVGAVPGLPDGVGRLILAAVPLLVVITALPWIWSIRRRWVAAAGLLLVVLSAALSQLLLAGVLLALLLLLDLVAWREFAAPRARWFAVSLAFSATLWTAFAVWQAVQAPEQGMVVMLQGVAHQVAGFPDIITEILHPWGAAQLVVSALLGIALLVLAWRSVSGRDQGRDVPALLALIIVMALAVGVSEPPRHETRYTFFLYPLLIVLGLTALSTAFRQVPARAGRATALLVVVAMLLFGVSEDFRLRHILTIDSAEANFRERFKGWQKNHLYPRYDFHAVADWLDRNTRPEDVVISGVPTVPYYFPGTDYSFLDENDDRYSAYACQRGTVDRWSNLPLLYPTDALEEIVAGGEKVFVVAYPQQAERLADSARERGWQVEVARPTRQKDIAVLEIE